jgi:hypothetical protein
MVQVNASSDELSLESIVIVGCWKKKERSHRGDDYRRDGCRQEELTRIVGANRRGGGRAPMASMSTKHTT